MLIMAMRSCPECGKKISSKATKCPHCGISREEIQKIDEKEYRQFKSCFSNCGCIIFAILLFLALFTFGAMSN